MLHPAVREGSQSSRSVEGLQGPDLQSETSLSSLMKPEESHSARDTLCRLEEELINLEEHPLVHH